MVPMEIRVTLRSVLAKALISMVPPSPVLGQASPPLAPGSCTQGQHHTTRGPAYGKKLPAAADAPLRSEVRGTGDRYGLVSWWQEERGIRWNTAQVVIVARGNLLCSRGSAGAENRAGGLTIGLDTWMSTTFEPGLSRRQSSLSPFSMGCLPGFNSTTGGSRRPIR